MLFITHIQQAVETRRNELASLTTERARLEAELSDERHDIERLQEDVRLEEETKEALQDRWLGLHRDIEGLRRQLPALQDEYVDCLRQKERLSALIQATQAEMVQVVADFKKRVREDDADDDVGPVAGRLRSRKKSRHDSLHGADIAP